MHSHRFAQRDEVRSAPAAGYRNGSIEQPPEQHKRQQPATTVGNKHDSQQVGQESHVGFFLEQPGRDKAVEKDLQPARGDQSEAGKQVVVVTRKLP